MAGHDKRQFIAGEHLIDCDICGRKRYRSECRWTWDGFIACLTSNCWYPKDPLFYIPPVINDPRTLFDVRPAPQSPDQYPQINPIGFLVTWGRPYPLWNPSLSPGTWGAISGTLTWGNLDTNPSYIP